MKRCDPRAYARCSDRHICGLVLVDACFTEGSECDEFNQQALSQPLTNADRIRAMSDEELCEFLMCDPVCDQNHSPDCGPCEKCIMAWLQQPTEEES